ncbi:DUF4114 domain-containing protein [Baaleninema sp.]|uniref:DUF4114 domain-containing protein n=1 Tax=Baaleninema sp. TaxID=3101197 RepID=UPI003CFF4EE8
MTMCFSSKLSTVATGTALVLSSTILGASPASAISFGTSIDCDPAASGDPLDRTCSLQSRLDDMTVSGGIDTTQDTGFDYFTNTASGGSIGRLMFEVAGFASGNKFGIFNQDGVKAELFDGFHDEADRTIVDFLSGGDLLINTTEIDPVGSTVTQTIANFGNIFGFYLENPEGDTFFSDISLNSDGRQHSAIYQGDNSTVLDLPGVQPGVFTDNEFIIAFEDLPEGHTYADFDYNDFVVIMESIDPAGVPEPSTLFGLGLVVSAAIASRHRQSRRR